MNWTFKTPLLYHFILGSRFRIYEIKIQGILESWLRLYVSLPLVFESDLLPFVLRPSGDPPDAGWQEAAPCGGVPVSPGSPPHGGGQSQEQRTSRPGAGGRDSQHAAALGRRAGHAGTEAIHLGRREAHRLVASRWSHGPRRWVCWGPTPAGECGFVSGTVQQVNFFFFSFWSCR